MHAVVLAVGIVVFTLYQCYYSRRVRRPLSTLDSLPAAHPLCHFTSLWIQWHRICGREFQVIDAAFRRGKGQYIRIAPHEIVVNDMKAVRCAWGVGRSNFDKHFSYKYFQTHGATNTFTALSILEHRQRRHRIKMVYSRNFLLHSPDMRSILRFVVEGKLEPLIESVASSPDRTVSILPLSQAYVLDFVSAFAFGRSLALDFLPNVDAFEEWLSLYNDSYPGGMFGFLLKEYPRFMAFVQRFPLMSSTRSVRARRKLERWASNTVDIAEDIVQQSLQQESSIPTGDMPMLYRAVRAGMASENKISEKDFIPSLHQRNELASECLDHISSTGETFGTTLTYMLYELSTHPEIQPLLRNQLLTLPRSHARSSPEHSQALTHLTLLDGIIRESLRLRNTSPGLDPRVSPSSQPCGFGAIAALPANTRVGRYGALLGRDAEIFSPNPEEWDPFRWVDNDGEGIARMTRSFLAFGSGARGCIGEPIAMELLRLALVTIYTDYETSVADASEYPGRGLMSAGCTETLLLRFEKVGGADG